MSYVIDAFYAVGLAMVVGLAFVGLYFGGKK